MSFGVLIFDMIIAMQNIYPWTSPSSCCMLTSHPLLYRINNELQERRALLSSGWLLLLLESRSLELNGTGKGLTGGELNE